MVAVSVRTLVPSRAAGRPWWLLCALGATILAALVAPSAVAAQDTTNTLQSIDPADGTTLGESPTAITLSFNQEIDDGEAVTVQVACNNQPQDTATPEVNDDGLVVTAAINTPLPRGACTITWRLADADGETIISDFSTFSVTADPPATGATTATTVAGATTATNPFITVPAVPAEAATDATVDEGSTGGALWLGRWLSSLGILIVFGALALISIGWPEGPEYVVTVRFLRTMWVVGLLGTLLYIVTYTAQYADVSLGAALNPTEWFDLRNDGWPGRGALARLVLVVGTGWVAMRPERIIDPTSSMLAWAIPGLAVISVALGRVDGPAPVVGFAAGALHMLASAIWVGGAVLVARVVLAGPGEEDLVQATRAFSRISGPAIVVTCLTGIVQVVRLDGGNLFSSSHGQVLFIKVVTVAVMLAVSLAAKQQVAMRLDRAHEMTVPLADRFRRAFGAEAVLGVVVIGFSSWLLGLTPPKIDPLPDQDYAVEVPFIDPTTGIEATVSIGPSAVGLNGLRVEVDAPADGITSLSVTFTPPAGVAGRTIEQPIALTTAGTAVLDQSVGIPFDAPGSWTIALSASTATGFLDGASTTFLVTNADGSIETIPPVASSVPTQVTIIDQSTTTAPFATTTTTTTTTPPSTSAPAG